MANARTSTAARGFALFLNHPYKDYWAFEDINADLGIEGLEPIARRTFSHYVKLWAAGEKEYTPINRWDVAHGR